MMHVDGGKGKLKKGVEINSKDNKNKDEEEDWEGKR